MTVSLKKSIVITGIVILVVIITVSVFLPRIAGRFAETRNQDGTIRYTIIPQRRVTSYLDGIKKKASQTHRAVYAVMVDNHEYSRAYQTGLSSASIFYEALAEGGITRIMALFDGPLLAKVGPVRSARPYFIDWAEEYRAVYLHVGGSDDAMADVARSKDIFNIEGMIYEGIDEYFKRDKKIPRPHNDFANLEAIESNFVKVQAWDKRINDLVFQFGNFGELDELVSEDAKTVKFHFGPFEQYNVRYEYNPELIEYARFIGGEKHLDSATQSQLHAANILVQFTPYWVLDDKGRLAFKTTGSGKALLFRNGKMFKGTWERKKDEKKTRFYDEASKEFVLKPGQTWIEVINEEWRVTWIGRESR